MFAAGDIPSLDHALLDESLSLFEAFTEAIGRPEARERLRPLEQRYRSGLYRLVMVGEEKRGKSSLAAALLGEPELLPTGPEPMTAAVFKIVYGERLQHRVFFLPGDPDDPEGSRPAPRDVTPAEVAAFGTAAGNPDNAKRVDFIAVEHPHPLLEAGLTIVDLPGLGGLDRAHGMLTMSYLPNADAAVFVVDSVAGPLTRDEAATLRRLRGFTEQILFVQTKTDAASADQWRGWRERNLDEIAAALDLDRDAIPYFAVSNSLKLDHDRHGDPEDLRDSGFEPLLALFQEDLLPRKLDRLALPMLAMLVQEVAEGAQPLENEIAILSARTDEEVSKLEAELRDGQRAYAQWKGESLPEVMSQYRSTYRQAVLDAQRRLSIELDPAPHGPIVGMLMNEVSSRDVSAAEIEAQSAAINDAAIALCAERLEQIGKAFETASLAAYDEAAARIGEATQPLLIVRPSVGRDLPTIIPPPAFRSGLWQAAMQGRLGFMAGAMAAGMIAGFFFPVGLATLTVTALSGLFGATRSIKDARRRERDMAERQLRALLSDSARRMSQRGGLEFAAAAERNQAAMTDSLQSAVRRRDAEEQAAFAALDERRRKGREETAARVRELSGLLAKAAAVLASLRRAGLPIAEAASGGTA